MEQFAAIGVRIGTHTAVTRRRQRGELFTELPSLVEQFLRLVASHPIFELLQMFGLLEIRDRHLMRAPSTLDRFAIDEFRSGPALGRTENDHRPAWTLQALLRASAGGALDVTDLKQNAVERPGKTLMHECGIVTLNKMRIVTVATQQLRQFLAADAGQHRRVGDLEPVQMKDRKYRAVACGVQEFVGMPTSRESPGLSFAIADDAADDQIRVIEGGTIGMSQRISQFAALVNRAGGFRRYVAGNPVRPGKLAK